MFAVENLKRKYDLSSIGREVDIELVQVDTEVRAVVVLAVIGLEVIVIFIVIVVEEVEVVTLLEVATPLTVAVALVVLVVTIKLLWVYPSK